MLRGAQRTAEKAEKSGLLRTGLVRGLKGPFRGGRMLGFYRRGVFQSGTNLMV